MKSFFNKAWLVIILLLSGCTAVPDGIEPVEPFELQRYLGTWYEIARLDHPFERGLSQITANYSLRPDGGVSVLNKGYAQEEQEWQEAEGTAYFVDEKNTGHLKVSFFGPFYASYVVFYLDQRDYQYALVTGPDRDYFWILSRQPKINDELMENLINIARNKGFAVDKLIYVEHQ